ncbi:SepM family pheromone-processing serine protease [Streptococcus dentiloxodontae]
MLKNNNIFKRLGRFVWRLKWWILGTIALLGLLFTLFFPLDYYVEMPGGAYDIDEVMTVDGKTDDEKGSYNFVAVAQSRATLAQLIYAYLTDFTEISTVKETTGDYSAKEYELINQYYMETSQNTAIYQGLTLAGKTVSFDYLGVYVLNVSNNSSFKGVLNIADTVTGVNGRTFNNSDELITYVQSLELGSKVTVQYTSDGKSKEAKGTIVKIGNGKTGIGIGLVDHTEISSDTKVNFSTGSVGGPSAGLMFTLAIYDQLSEQDLKQGRTIAGTGTVEMDGSVGDIGGAYLKVKAAADAGAEIFFVPNNPVSDEQKKADPDAKSNYEEAKKAAKDLDTDMKIVPVTTVQDAIDYLKETAKD